MITRNSEARPPFIPGGRYVLRWLDLRDASALFETVYGDSDVMRFVAGGAHKNVAETEAAIARYIAHGEQHGFTFWAIEDADAGELLGDCGLHLIEGRGPDIEFGVTLRKSSWGAGIGTTCARACISHAFDHLGLNQLVAVARTENAGSVRLPETSGFRHTGVVAVYGGPHERFQIDARSRRQEANHGD